MSGDNPSSRRSHVGKSPRDKATRKFYREKSDPLARNMYPVDAESLYGPALGSLMASLHCLPDNALVSSTWAATHAREEELARRSPQ
ncbi:hypothetical protein Pan189_11260 [Stratiformator vulcanicus]|uniref:Uncharacterized protein n=1 Tax=Stratiformator vulcanicus TaxID=2527980 RepID=A0A517QYU5_9PLAN|nr:hypothetical protein Pan189_11260 [Stratiformator vulcanicus]